MYIYNGEGNDKEDGGVPLITKKQYPPWFVFKTFSHWFLATSLWYPLVWFSCVYLAWIALCLLILQAAFFCWGDSFIKFEPILAIIFFLFLAIISLHLFFLILFPIHLTPQNSISSMLDYPVISRRPPKLWSFVYLCVCGLFCFLPFSFWASVSAGSPTKSLLIFHLR